MAYAGETAGTPANPKRIHKEVTQQLVAHRKPEHAQKPVVEVADDASSEYDEDDISIISQADDAPLDEEQVQVTTTTAAAQSATAVQMVTPDSKLSDSDTEDEDE